MSDNQINQWNALGPIAIVGAAGKMGKWFADLFESVGLVVHRLDKDTLPVERSEALKGAATVLVSVPIADTCQVVEELIPQISRDALLTDLTSIKERALSSMMHHQGEVLGLHPMCAPAASGLAHQPIVTCLGREGEKGKLLCRLLESWGARLVKLDAAKHDQLMAVVQGLNHFHSIAFAHALGAIGISVEESMQVASPVYQLRMQLMGRILAQDPRLYVDIEVENPYVPAVLEHFQNSLRIFHDAITSKSIEDCLRFFKQAADFMGPYRFIALKESDEVLNRL